MVFWWTRSGRNGGPAGARMAMKRATWAIGGVVLAAAGLTGGILVMARTDGGSADAPALSTALIERVRDPAVAGLFYPADRKTLVKQVEGFLAGTTSDSLKNVRALICPHAGYSFSGSTAAEAYKQLTGRKIKTVVVMGPAHYAAFQGASIPGVDAYRTPLGKVRVSAKAHQLAKKPPFARNPLCKVQRPQWWRRASKTLPPFGSDTAHTWEHSLEVQLPFLQKVLGEFELIPIVFGKVDPAAAAKVLNEHVVDDRTVLVASSDLSHYYPYEMAHQLDKRCTEAIVALNFRQMSRAEACGMRPILVVMHIARMRGWKAKLLKYCNSGDTGGNKSGVVGYAAIAFYDSPGSAPVPQSQPNRPGPSYSPGEREFLLKLSRRALTEAVRKGTPLEIDPGSVPAHLMEPKGCFVTLAVDGKLRGCIGQIFPRESLYKAVAANALNAALRDKRFALVKPEELGRIEIEISVLTIPVPLHYESSADLVGKLRVHTDGIVLRSGEREATYLPQVWDHFPNKGAFLSSLSRKAGLPPDAWSQKGVVILTYQAEAFKESETKTPVPH